MKKKEIKAYQNSLVKNKNHLAKNKVLNLSISIIIK